MVARRSAQSTWHALAGDRCRKGHLPRRGRCIRTAECSMAETRFDCLPAGNLKPTKDKSTERIDGIVAAIMAIGRAMIAQDKPQVLYQMIWV
jgi:hypothetical protein